MTHNELKQGNRIFDDSFTTDEFPYYYRAGAIIPQYPVQRTVQETPDTIVLQVIPGADGKGRLYEDHGDNQDYRDGAYANTLFQQRRTAEGITVDIAARQGSYPGMPDKRAWRVEFLGQTAPEHVTLDGEEMADGQYCYDADLHLLTVVIPKGEAGAAHTLFVKAQVLDEPIASGSEQPIIAAVEEGKSLEVKNIVNWTSYSDTHAQYTFNGSNHSELQQTVVAFDPTVWGCSMKEGDYPVLKVFGDVIPDAIDAVSTTSSDQIFDLQGRKVSHTQKGLYIKNGKAVIIK